MVYRGGLSSEERERGSCLEDDLKAKVVYFSSSIVVFDILCTHTCTYTQVSESLHTTHCPTGEEELQLKKKRDTSYARCSDLRKKLKSSREAQQQIAAFTSKTNSALNTTA